MKTTEKILAYAVLTLTITLASCSKEVIENPNIGRPEVKVIEKPEADEGTQISVKGDEYTFDIAYEFPTTQLVLKFPSSIKEQRGSREVRVYLTSTMDGTERLYQVPGFGVNVDHAMNKIDKQTETVIEFVGLEGNHSYSVPFGYYQKATVIVVDRSAPSE